GSRHTAGKSVARARMRCRSCSSTDQRRACAGSPPGLQRGAQFYVPVDLQRVGDQTMGGIHLHVTMTGAIGLVLGSLDLAEAQVINLIETGHNLLLHGKSELERHRRDGIDEQLPDRGVDPSSQNTLAQWIAEEPAPA